MMHPQLAEITQILKEDDVTFWADSGTLLGLVREGDVMDHDKDIDLSVWSDQAQKVRALFHRFEAAGYHVREGVWDTKPYNFVLRPRNGEGITVSIGVYRRNNGKAWRMATFVTDNPYPRWSLRFLLRGLWRFPLRQVMRVATLFVHRARLSTKWPFSLVLGTGVWIIPGEYLERTIAHEATGLPIPERYNAYLTYRYGDWREPVRDWAWYRDDRAAHIGAPESLMKQIEEAVEITGPSRQK